MCKKCNLGKSLKGTREKALAVFFAPRLATHCITAILKTGIFFLFYLIHRGRMTLLMKKTLYPQATTAGRKLILTGLVFLGSSLSKTMTSRELIFSVSRFQNLLKNFYHFFAAKTIFYRKLESQLVKSWRFISLVPHHLAI